MRTIRLIRSARQDAGLSVLELMFSLAIVATLCGIAIPQTASALDEMRTAMAARYLAGKIVQARLDALQRSSCVALRFEPAGDDYRFGVYADGNRNGVRTAEISSGVDPLISSSERLGDNFANVRFGLPAGVPDLDGARQTQDADGVRMGSARMLTLSPDGTATPGTVYIRGRRGQYAVRVLGATARTRIFQYHSGAGIWIVR